MNRAMWILLGTAATGLVGVGVAVALREREETSPATGGKGEPQEDDDTMGGQINQSAQRAKRRQELKAAGEKVEEYLGWDGLADFLDMFAYTESRWSYTPNGEDAFVDGPKNRAIGPYQMRPDSAASSQPEYIKKLVGKGGIRPDLLQDPAFATAAIVSYLARTVKSQSTWANLRAAGAFPIFVNGRPTKLIEGIAKKTKFKTLEQQQERYDDSIKRFIQAVQALNYSPAFPGQRAGPAPTGSKGLRADIRPGVKWDKKMPDLLTDVFGISIAQLKKEAMG